MLKTMPYLLHKYSKCVNRWLNKIKESFSVGFNQMNDQDYSDKILACTGLRWHKQQLEQRLRVQRSFNHTKPIRVEVTEEWVIVPGIRHRSKWADRVKWDEMDWTKNNNQLGREMKLSPQLVGKFRNRLGKPPAERKVGSGKRKIDPELLRNADWENKIDVELARAWGVSRERVRQLRDLQGRPCLVRNRTYQSRLAAKWLAENAQKISGQHMHDVIRQMPGALGLPTKRDLVRESGIVVDENRRWTASRYTDTLVPKTVNWDLPNKFLHMIYIGTERNGKNWNRVATDRSRLNAPKSKWWSSGFANRFIFDPEFHKALEVEIKKAKAMGRIVDEKTIHEHIEKRRNFAKS